MSTLPKVLLIEDSQTLRDLVLQILEIENYAVAVAVDGEQGLKLARESTPDLILCDITMPKMSGLEVLRAVRSDPATAAVPFIFLTARAERGDLRVGMDLGADDYLTKPFDADELLAAVRARLRKHQSIRSAALEANERRQSELLVNLPHEVRTPLSGILGLAELLSESDFSREERRAMVADILASGRRLERTLTNLLLHLELELARHSPDRALAFVGTSPAIVGDALRAAASIKGEDYKRAINVHVTAEDLLVRMDGPLLRKAVEELIDNALHYSASGSAVRVNASRVGAQIVIEVFDQGVGMTAEQIARVQTFRKFERSQRVQPGLGLGLAITRALVEMNGGTLGLAPNSGAGLTATLRLPAAE